MGWERKIIVQYYYHEQLTDLDVTGFGVIYEHRPHTYMPPHWHQAVELLMVAKGSITCKFSHSTIQAGPGDVFLINSHDVHETRCTRGTRYVCIHILPSAMCRYMANFDRLSFSLKFDPDDPVKSQALDQLREHMGHILRQKEAEEEFAGLEMHGRLFGITAILVKFFSQIRTVEEAKIRRSDMSRLEPLLEFTQVHHSEPLTLDGAAEYMGLNREYFCRLFKKNMGVSFLQYLYQVRATAVCRELERNDDPISEIAERHGFKDPKMLSQYFKEIYGCTPSEKRKFFREVTVDNQ